MRAAAMLVIGKSLEQLKRPKAALAIFGQILIQYPDKAESLFSIVAMADISVNHPGIIYPIGRPGAEYVNDPIHAYDTVLARNVPQPMIEHIQYYKGLALWKLKRYERALEVQADFLKNFPSTVYRKEVQTMLKDTSANLIKHHYAKGDHLSVIQYFLQGWEDKLITSEDSELLLKSAASLSALGLHDDSSTVIKALKEKNVTITSIDINKIMAEIDKKRSGGQADQVLTIPSWDKYHTGREYLRVNDLTKAEKTFADLKTSETDPFWSKIIDYAMEEKKWARKYQLSTKK
jgi:TolA-binding protein